MHGVLSAGPLEQTSADSTWRRKGVKTMNTPSAVLFSGTTGASTGRERLVLT